mgnify:CR=1 FL=1
MLKADSNINQVDTLLSNDKLVEATSYLLSSTNSKAKKGELINLLGRLSALEIEQRNGLIIREDYKIERNRIRICLLDIGDEMKEELKEITYSNKKAFRRDRLDLDRTFKVTLLLFITASGFLFLYFSIGMEGTIKEKVPLLLMTLSIIVVSFVAFYLYRIAELKFLKEYA